MLALGFRASPPGGPESWVWKGKGKPKPKDAAPRPGNAFGALADLYPGGAAGSAAR